MLKLPIRRCPNCWYVGPTRRFAVEGGSKYVCPRCGTEIEAPDPRLN